MEADDTGGLRVRFERYVRAQLARVLTQLDRDVDSPTFGDFDRYYWHYKVHDFSSSILQQGIFTLEGIRSGSVASSAPASVIERWCLGAVNALAGRVGRGGGVSEYYPHERSYPAAAFGLYAACRVLCDWRASAPHLLAAVDWASVERLARHVAKRSEEQATNQQAAGLAGLALAAKLNIEAVSSGVVDLHATRLFGSQHPEGWFTEYGGPDFGYLTVTLDALADYYEATGDVRALDAVDRAVAFLAKLVGADGRLPSTLNSRNTDYVVPYGLVRAGARNPEAAWLAETLFRDIDQASSFVRATDDRYHVHYVFASVVRSLPHLEKMKSEEAPSPERVVWMEGCGFMVAWSADRRWTAYVGGRKGGLVRIHRRGERPPIIEHGWRVRAGSRLWTTNWWSSHWSVSQGEGGIRIQGSCQRARFHTPTPLKHALLRVLALVMKEKLVWVLKRLMIFRPSGADGPPFERVVEITPRSVRITDRLGAFNGATAAPGPRQNVRHVASAGSFSAEEWLPSLLGSATVTLDRERFVETRWEADEG